MLSFFIVFYSTCEGFIFLEPLHLPEICTGNLQTSSCQVILRLRIHRISRNNIIRQLRSAQKNFVLCDIGKHECTYILYAYNISQNISGPPQHSPDIFLVSVQPNTALTHLPGHEITKPAEAQKFNGKWL